MPDDAETGRRAHPQERLEQAARAAWLYYIGGRTQDEIAAALNISRQAAQRLVSLALAEKLIKFRVDHPIAACMALGEALTQRFGLRGCEVVPQDGPAGALAGVAVAGARLLERWFSQKAPIVLGVSTGRTLRAVAAELSPLAVPQHKVFSLCGIIARDGRAIAAEPVMQLAERTGAQCFPMPLPVVVATLEERRLLQSQQAYHTLTTLYAESRFLMVGIGEVGWQAPIHATGCITDGELTELMQAGAAGEIAGFAFDAAGRMLTGGINERVTGLSVTSAHAGITVGVAAGPAKVAALQAALEGRLINAVITDEPTAASLLAGGRNDLTSGENS